LTESDVTDTKPQDKEKDKDKEKAERARTRDFHLILRHFEEISISQISASGTHAAALSYGGQVYTWGLGKV